MSISGLDFGTSNSTVGVVKNGANVMVPLEKDTDDKWQTTLPSALFFDFETDQIHFGRTAIAQYTSGHPGRLMRSMKSLLGSAYMADKTQVRNRFYSYDEIVGFFVSSLKQQAEVFLDNESLASVVIGRPVFFNDDDQELDKAAENHLADIARLAGYKDCLLYTSPSPRDRG